MKRLIIFVIVTFFTLSPNILLAAARYDGPKTIEQAKERFFKNKKLDIIEGIWYAEKENSYRAIVKVRDGVYNQWTITSRNSNYIGTLDLNENVIRSASDKVYIYHTTVYNLQNLSEEKEGNGTFLLTNNLIEYSVNPVCWTPGRCSKIINGTQMRIWPNNIYDHNANVQIKVDNFNPQENKAKRSEKLSSKLNDNNSSTDYKSYWWVLVLLAGVAFFIYTQTKKSFKKKEKIVKPKAIKKEDSFFKKFFEGRKSLGFSYWVMFTAVPAINALIFYALESSKSIDKDSRDTIAGLFGWWMLAFFIYATIGTWRSAAAYKLEKESKKEGFGWAIAAYVTIVISIISFIGRVIKNLNS